jgi:hypothetical protein
MLIRLLLVKTPATAYPKHAVAVEKEAFRVHAVVGVFTTTFPLLPNLTLYNADSSVQA